MVRETRHLWVGNMPENVREKKIIEHFKRYGRVIGVKILPKRGSEGGVAAFVDFVDIKSAQKAHNSINKMGDRDLRTNYNEPGTIPSAARRLDDTVSIASRSREVSGFRGGGGGPTYGPPPSLHAREGRYERRLDGASDNRERAYEHSAYGHHERGTGAFDRTRHYDQDYYRDPRERTLQHGLYYSSRSRSPSRFETHDPRYEPRAREQFTLPSVVHRDIYRDDLTREVRGRRPERNYQHSRSRSPHSSQSRTQSPQRLASQASRPTRSPSGSGSRSRSSSSDSISSSIDLPPTQKIRCYSSRSSSDESPARSAVPAPTYQLLPSLEKDEPRKSFGIKVQNLPVRSTDTSLKDGLFHEFKKYGKMTSMQIHGASEERYGLVFFRQQEDQEKALNASKGKLFFGMQIEVTAWIGPETESLNEDERLDEFHPRATRTLFIGNLEKTTTYHDLHNIFQHFGGIVGIEIKRVNGVPQYAFLQYCDIASVCKAIKKMDGEYLGNNRLKLGFGKSMPTNCVWLDGLSTNVTDQYLTRHFCRYGPVVKVAFDRLKGMALVLYNETEYAQAAVEETKGRKIGGNKIKVDFANHKSQLAFCRSMKKTGQDIRDFYEMLAERRCYSSSSSSDESPARSAVPAPTYQLLPSLEKNEPYKSFGIKVQNLPVRSTDTGLKDGLFHEFKKYGKVTSVQIHGASEERYGLVFFRQQEDQEKALNASKGKLFFGMQIEVTAWIGPETESENEFQPLDERRDEFHPRATRTLFIGNLEKTTTYHDLRNIFQRFGWIGDIDIKKVNGVPQYAFLQYCDIASVCKAIKKMDGEYLGNNRLKLGFGKSMPTNCVWLDGLSTNVTDQYLTRHFCRYGPVVKVAFDRLKGMALVLYNETEYAQAAVEETKGRKIGGNKIKVDFANHKSQLAFCRSMKKTGQDIRDFYEMLAERRDERRGSYDYAADRTYYEAVRTPGTYPEDPRREYPAHGREFYADWDPYQGDYYDPREYRDDRGDPYEEDIREYSYRQRERERFESDRDRDHKRRPIERSQSPAHSWRPQSPGASPSQRLQSDSERSGSCSSLSPPRYDKPDKARLERHAKNEKPEKERAFEQERPDKDKRLVRKEKPEKPEKEKTEKQKRKAKVHSPSSQSSETDPENERDPSPEKIKSGGKLSRERADKEGAAKNRLELMPCVVLTRVKEKEGKVTDPPALEKLRGKQENDATARCPLLEPKLQAPQGEQSKADQMIRMSTGHMEGNLQLVFVLLTDCYVYLIRKGAAEKPYMVEEAVSYNELDYVSVGLDQQTVTLVCTNRRKQFLLDTADATLTEFFLASLKSAMIKGCREPPYPSILTDATMEKLALAKFVAQESKREASEVVVRFYGLVHWEDPLDEAPGPAPSHYTLAESSITKEGMLSYKAGTNYLGKENWRSCFVVLSNGILYQYPDRTDVTPLLSVNMGGEQCGGCRRSNTTDRPHAFQVILSDRPSLELSAENEEEMADWMQFLCQAVSKGVVPQGVAPAPCIPCCLVVTEQKVFTCHEDCQTSFFRSLASAELGDVASVSTEPGREYCLVEFVQDRKQYLPPWVLYFSCTAELERFLSALGAVWKNTYQVDLSHKLIEDGCVRKKCEDALSLIHSAWQRSDSLCRGRASRDPWC